MIKALTIRENEVVAEVAKDFTIKEVASNLFISPYTVDSHIKTAKRKTNTKTLSGLTRLFVMSLENPKQFFKISVAIVFLSIQAFSIASVDIENYRKPSKRIRTHKVARRIKQ